MLLRYHRYGPLYILLLFLPYLSTAHQADSLRALLPSLGWQERITALNQIAAALSPQEGLEEAKQALTLSQRHSYPEGKAEALIHLADISFDYFDTDTLLFAFECYNKAEALYAKLGLSAQQLRALRGLVRASYGLNDFEASLDFAFQLEKLAEALDDQKNLGYAYNHFARIYGRVSNNSKLARYYLLKALDKYRSIRRTRSMPRVYSDLGSSYFNAMQYDSALYYYQAGYLLADSLDLSYESLLLKTNMASTYVEQAQHEKAMNCVQEIIVAAEKHELLDIVGHSYNLMAQIYIEQGRIQQAKEAIQHGLTLAKAANDLDVIESLYEKLIALFEEGGDYQNAYEYAQYLQAVRDSIKTEENFLKINNLKTAYELDKKKQEVKTLEQEARLQRNERNLILLTAVLLITILLWLYNRYRLRAKLQQQQIEGLKTRQEMEQKEKLLLRHQLDYKERELASQTLRIIQKNELLTELKENIEQLEQPEQKKLAGSISRIIKQNSNFDDDWQKFKLHFDQVHPHFFEKIKQQYPELSLNEMRLCAYMRMGLATKEIAQLLGISAAAIQKARYRLKKKMGLSREQELFTHISNI